MKVNHHSLAYKMRAKPNKTYKDLKQKQKAKISDWMFRKICAYYKEHGAMPDETQAVKMIEKVYEKIKSCAIWVPYDEVCRVLLSRISRCETRIIEQGIPEEKPAKEKNPDTSSRKGNSKKTCPNCGRKMTQQFIGLQHCRCGMSWMKDTGYFERTENMIFALERRRKGKKVKQVPVIHCKN